MKKAVQRIKVIAEKMELKKVFAPSAIAAVCTMFTTSAAFCFSALPTIIFFYPFFRFQVIGFIIGTISPIRKLLIGDTAPLHVLDTSIYLIGYVLFQISFGF